jgi:nucleoside 2-deoxyribosyltransferase
MTAYYLAGPYARLYQLATYHVALEAIGHTVTSSWLRGQDAQFDATLPPDKAAQWAQQDLADIAAAEVLLAFTEIPESPHRRGGRHFEAGYAYALGKPIIVIGPTEHAFYCLPDIQHSPDWDTFYRTLLHTTRFERTF